MLEEVIVTGDKMEIPHQKNEKPRKLKAILHAYLTPPEIARLLRVCPEKVLGWIRRGNLRAINVSDGVRPRYRVRRECLDEFLASLEVQPPAPRERRRRNDRPPEGGPLAPELGEKLLKK